ncbi:hypothetical protein NQZ68_020037 [Xyrichtys novacula]|uniref:Uncharacterized protein n=1 Tax=Xyrichtys novacula TaxID=13765 RepID=A0AAV1FNM8_XYRNO|nr:hypothetical protein NQZ68_020037 [Xyrichtys novacula]
MGVDFEKKAPPRRRRRCCCCFPISAFQITGSFVLSVEERSSRTLPFIPLLLQSLWWKWKIGPKAWACEEGLAAAARAHQTGAVLIKLPSIHPRDLLTPIIRLTPPPSRRLLFFLTPSTPPSQHPVPSSDHGAPFAVLKAPRGLHIAGLLVAFVSQSAAPAESGTNLFWYRQKITTAQPLSVKTFTLT